MENQQVDNPKTAMDNFTRTMKALFKVPKSEVQEKKPKTPLAKKPQQISKPSVQQS